MIRTGILTTLLCMALGMQAQKNDLFILGGELSNSAATSVTDIDEVMPRMRMLGLNTVLVPAYWEFMEPQEGQFDFTLIDRVVSRARENDLKVVFLWFGAWKNSMSCYAPLWFKQDVKRFPRAQTTTGKPLEIASCFSDNVFQADNRAFHALISHLSETARDVVTMVQVENEIGMLEDARDHSHLANAAYQQGVPQELIRFLKKRPLHPWLQQRFNAKGRTWTEVFGDDLYTDEIFMAYYYARYVGRLCETAKSIWPALPLYVNAAMNSRGRQPGQYPSAGPLAHLIDLWHAGAPQLLCLAPDIYDTGFQSWADQYALPNNRLFIPESRCCENSGVRTLYVFGEHRALGFSPFAIDQANTRETESVVHAYELLKQLSSLAGRESKSETWGLLFTQDDRERIIEDDGNVLTCRHYFTLPWDPRATDGSTWPEGGAIVIKLSKNEYLIAGSGVVVTFQTKSEKAQEEQRVLGEDGFVVTSSANDQQSPLPPRSFAGQRLGIGYVDQVSITADGQMQFIRRDNGDQDHQGRHARIGVGEWKILHVKLYEY